MKTKVARDQALKVALDGVRERCDVELRRAADPVGAVHRYESLHDREIVALIASCVAFGNVRAIRTKLDDALLRLAPSPALAADDPESLFAKMDGWVHRVYRGEDIARLILGARRVQRSHGSLGASFKSVLERSENLRDALAAFCDAIREAGGLPAPSRLRLLPQDSSNDGARKKSDVLQPANLEGKTRRGPAHLLPDPWGGSGSKRLLLFLRWMVRPADGVDLGLWDVPTKLLLCPVDTHIHKLARNISLTKRTDLSWRTAEEITSALARLDPDDPVKYDFALCHLGMLQRCPSRRDKMRCEGCGVRPICRHWQKKGDL